MRKSFQEIIFLWHPKVGLHKTHNYRSNYSCYYRNLKWSFSIVHIVNHIIVPWMNLRVFGSCEAAISIGDFAILVVVVLIDVYGDCQLYRLHPKCIVFCSWSNAFQSRAADVVAKLKRDDNNNIFSFRIQTDRPQPYKYSMNIRSQVITRVEFNCLAAMQSDHHVII